MKKCVIFIKRVLILGCTPLSDTLLSAPLNVTIREIEVNSAVVTWEILEGDPVIGFAVTQQVPPSAAWLLQVRLPRAPKTPFSVPESCFKSRQGGSDFLTFVCSSSTEPSLACKASSYARMYSLL